MDLFLNNTIPFNSFKQFDVLADGACLYRVLNIHLIKYKSNFISNPDFLFIYENPDDISMNNIDEYSHKIQILTKKWLVDHQNDIVDNLNISIKDFILLNHENVDDIDEYNDLFDIFAGDDDFFLDDDNKVINLPLRWGTTAEMYAFSKIFNINIHQWILVRWNKFLNKESPFNFRKKDHRFRLIQQIQHPNNLYDIHILFIENCHYKYLHKLI